MAKKKKRQANTQSATAKKKKETKPAPPITNEPWLGRRTGFLIIGMMSLGMFAYMVWQLYPTEGWGNALLWGSGFAVGIWVIFGISLSFNLWLRKRSRGGG